MGYVGTVCLGAPGRVMEVRGRAARVDFFGVERAVRLDVLEEPVAPGDYVVVNVGFAIRRLPTEEIAETLALFDEVADAARRS